MAYKERNPYCSDCFYYKTIWGDELRCCHYLLITNHKRPCDPGRGCTVKISEAKKRRQKKGTDHGKTENARDAKALHA
jgi:hypothetical protein